MPVTFAELRNPELCAPASDLGARHSGCRVGAVLLMGVPSPLVTGNLLPCFSHHCVDVLMYAHQESSLARRAVEWASRKKKTAPAASSAAGSADTRRRRSWMAVPRAVRTGRPLTSATGWVGERSSIERRPCNHPGTRTRVSRRGECTAFSNVDVGFRHRFTPSNDPVQGTIRLSNEIRWASGATSLKQALQKDSSAAAPFTLRSTVSGRDLEDKIESANRRADQQGTNRCYDRPHQTVPVFGSNLRFLQVYRLSRSLFWRLKSPAPGVHGRWEGAEGSPRGTLRSQGAQRERYARRRRLLVRRTPASFWRLYRKLNCHPSAGSPGETAQSASSPRLQKDQPLRSPR